MNGDVTVREVMDREYVGVSEGDGLLDTCEVMLREDAESVVVLRGSDPVGVVTERDVLAYLVGGNDPANATVSEVMTESVPTVDPSESLAAVADEMSTQATKRLVVTNGEEPLGVITEHDVIATASFGPELDERPDAETGLDMRTMQGTTETGGNEAAQGATANYEEQGICEVCGSLSRNLSTFNGQLLCAECRDM